MLKQSLPVGIRSLACIGVLLSVGLAGCRLLEPTRPPVASTTPVPVSQPPTPMQQAPAPEHTQKTVVLADVPMNQELFVTWDQLISLNQTSPPVTITYSTFQDSSHFGSPQWTLIKFRNGFYVRGYRVYDDENTSSNWFTSTMIENEKNCQSMTIPIQKLKALTGPPEVLDGYQKYETVDLPEEQKGG
ncbi:MAG TPA: hypothetical protein VKU00_20240 [Chthonomonadaceae bacterium]|nr:hypothetical protein [Chthonomonadaceae bacterium]